MSGKLPTVGMVSLGCPKNLVDAEVMLGHLQRAGHEIVSDGQARVVVVNTCGFIDRAKEESIETILEQVERKKRGEIDRVVVAGCMVQKYGRELSAEIPEVDAFLGLDELENAPGAAHPSPACPRCRGSRTSRSRPASTTSARRGCSRAAADMRTSKSGRGATTRARSARFPRCAACSGAGRSIRWSRRPRRSRRRASRSWCSSRRTRRATAKTSGWAAAGWRVSSRRSRRRRASRGSASSTRIPGRSTTRCST